MINSVNTLECLKPKLLTMDKFNSTTTTTELIPPSPSFSQTKAFVTFGSHLHNDTIDINKQQQLLNDEIYHQERVKVQHLENPTKLQNNNCWNNFRTLYNLSASSVVKDREIKKIHQTKGDNDVGAVNIEYTTAVTEEIPINIQNKSAFNLDFNNMKYHNNSIYINNNSNIKKDIIRTETNNNNQFYLKQYNNYELINKQLPGAKLTEGPTTSITATPQRSDYQNNVYRHIESVHNYAKLKSYEDDNEDNQSLRRSRYNIYLDDEDDEEDEDNNDDEEQCGNGDIDYEDRFESSIDEYPEDLNVDYEDIFSKRQRKLQKLATSSDGALFTKICNSRTTEVLRKPIKFVKKTQSLDVHNTKTDADEDTHVDVDVESIETQSFTIPIAESNSSNAVNHILDESVSPVKPDHHARRPMNAFLIFCKRHRAIVKERYKNLENRAITKILGDWWASLDDNDKKCFIDLAQENKDAFFSANPNFKWYKLPAPPLRTLTTRPANGNGQDYQENRDTNVFETLSNNTRSVSHNSNSNYFKLADEAQMGDLSQLMKDKSKATTKRCADLQQALGETSQFMNAHITGISETLEPNTLKRRFHNENSFSSNSSEDDSMEPKRKSVRSCKGKRYQELLNSGQIATTIKKSKSSTRLAFIGDNSNMEVNLKRNFTNINNNNMANSSISQKQSVSESENMMSYNLNDFDLEEKIKKLPALNLEDYLQRKRSIKKKKKFSVNGKKRGQRSNTNNNSNNDNSNVSNNVSNDNNNSDTISTPSEKVPLASDTHDHQSQFTKQHQQAVTAVGSQKRKARKESITRRDVSAIEQEVASLLPLTINGCCYFQEAPTAMKYMKSIEKDIKTETLDNVTTSSPIIPLRNPLTLSSSARVDILNNTNINTINNNNILNDNISSTSDLLILAEVAANRTELEH